ncbi:hypothetical protein PSPO01_12080 [Paraphaeosphaeria sporulosa]
MSRYRSRRCALGTIEIIPRTHAVETDSNVHHHSIFISLDLTSMKHNSLKLLSSNPSSHHLPDSTTYSHPLLPLLRELSKPTLQQLNPHPQPSYRPVHIPADLAILKSCLESFQCRLKHSLRVVLVGLEPV